MDLSSNKGTLPIACLCGNWYAQEEEMKGENNYDNFTFRKAFPQQNFPINSLKSEYEGITAILQGRRNFIAVAVVVVVVVV